MHGEDSRQAALAGELAALGFIPHTALWTPFQGGRTNHIWRVEFAGRCLVCKLFTISGGTVLFPNRPDDEVAALRHLDGTGLAPRLSNDLTTKQGQCLIYEYVDGAPWREGVGQVAELLFRLHQMPPPEGLRRIDGSASAISAVTEAILCDCTAVPDWLAAQCSTQTYPRADSASFLHGDAVPENIICAANGPVLIDWQCPAIGDPAHDLFTFISPAMQFLYRGLVLSTEEVEAFLMSYPNSTARERLKILRPHLHRRMAAHCLWKAERGWEDYQEALLLEQAALEQLRQP